MFSKLIFFFVCDSFDVKLRKKIIANLIVLYAYSFYEALKDGPYGGIGIYVMGGKDENSDEILNILKEEGNTECSFLIDFLL